MRSGSRTFGNIQGLRAIAALLVFGLHLSVVEPRFTGHTSLTFFQPLGNWGVDLFFVISGFVMITSTWQEFATPGISQRFLLRRFTRIYPPYFVVLIPIAILYIVQPSLVNASEAIKPDILASFLLLPQRGYGLLIVSWTLVYEVFFYLVFAVILNADRRYCVPLVASWGVFTIAVFFATRGWDNVYLHTYANTLLVEFIYGVILGYSTMRYGVKYVVPTLVCGIVLFVAADLTYTQIDTGWELHDSLRFVLIGIPVALIFNGVLGLETAFGWVVPNAVQSLGNASYSLYLWHVPLTIFVGRLSGHRDVLRNAAAHAAWLAVTTVFVVGASMIIYQLVERPMLRFFGARLRRRLAPGAAPAP